MNSNFNIILLHEGMVDKTKRLVTTSLTMIDVHDIARSAKTYGVDTTFFAHPSPILRKLARTLKKHWETGYGSEYNPDRKDALNEAQLVSNLDEAIHKIDIKTGKLPLLIATSAKESKDRLSFEELKKINIDTPILLMLGTGHGMSEELIKRADYFLEPVRSNTEYNHLSVRSACAIILDRLFGI